MIAKIKSYIISGLLGLTFLSCQQNTPIIEALSATQIDEINSLSTTDLKSKYLHQLWKDDQHFRKGQEGDIISKHGYRSPKHLEYSKKWKTHDNIVFLKLKKYLEVHDYPTQPNAYHELALNAFPIIIGHNHNFLAQSELLPYLYESYLEGNCDLDDVVWILGEMHESRFKGKRYQMKSERFTTEQEFTELVEVLNLDLKLR